MLSLENIVRLFIVVFLVDIEILCSSQDQFDSNKPIALSALATLHYIKKMEFFCGGTIISPLIVITTCRCLYLPPFKTKLIPSRSIMVMGGISLLQSSRVKTTIPHPRCKRTGLYTAYNWGIVKTKTPFNITSKEVQTITPFMVNVNSSVTDAYINMSTTCALFTWNIYTLNSTLHMIPTKKHMQLASKDNCKINLKYFELLGRPPMHDNSSMCGKAWKDQKTCTYYPGGPLYCHGLLTAIHSQEYNCKPQWQTNRLLYVYSRYDKIHDWLKQMASIFTRSSAIRTVVSPILFLFVLITLVNKISVWRV